MDTELEEALKEMEYLSARVKKQSSEIAYLKNVINHYQTLVAKTRRWLGHHSKNIGPNTRCWVEVCPLKKLMAAEQAKDFILKQWGPKNQVRLAPKYIQGLVIFERKDTTKEEE